MLGMAERCTQTASTPTAPPATWPKHRPRAPARPSARSRPSGSAPGARPASPQSRRSVTGSSPSASSVMSSAATRVAVVASSGPWSSTTRCSIRRRARTSESWSPPNPPGIPGTSGSPARHSGCPGTPGSPGCGSHGHSGRSIRPRSSKSPMLDPPFQPCAERRGVALDRREPDVQVTGLETRHRRLRRTHAGGHLGLGQPLLPAQGEQLPRHTRRRSAISLKPGKTVGCRRALTVHALSHIWYNVERPQHPRHTRSARHEPDLDEPPGPAAPGPRPHRDRRGRLAATGRSTSTRSCSASASSSSARRSTTRSPTSIIAQMLFLEAQNPERDISLYINSPGGVAYAGMAIYDVMQHVRAGGVDHLRRHGDVGRGDDPLRRRPRQAPRAAHPQDHDPPGLGGDAGVRRRTWRSSCARCCR